MRSLRWLTLVAILVGFGLRGLLLADKQALEYDDAISLLAATGHEGEYANISANWQYPIAAWVPAGEWKRLIEPEAGIGLRQVAADLATYDLHPPFYFWILNLWVSLFGANLLSLGTLNLVIDALTVLVLIGAGGWIFGDLTAGFLTGAVWVLSPVAMKTSFWVRQYTFLIFLSALFVYLLYRAFTQPQTRSQSVFFRLAAVAVGLAGLLTHYYFALLLAVGGLLLAASYLNGRKGRVWLLQGIALLAVIGLLFFLFYPGFLLTLATYVDSRLASRLIGFSLDERLKNAGKTLLILFSPALLGLGLHFASRRLAPGIQTGEAAGNPLTDPFAAGEAHLRYFRWILAFAIAPALILLLAYLAALTPVHTFSSRYLGFLSPFIAFVPVFLLRPPARPAWAITFLAGMFVLGILALSPNLAEAQKGTLDVHSLQTAPVVVVDSIAWGTWPAAVQDMRADQQVFIANQETLAADPGAWLERLSRGGIFVSFLWKQENTPPKRQAILDEIRQRYPLKLLSTLYRPGNWEISLYRVGN